MRLFAFLFFLLILIGGPIGFLIAALERAPAIAALPAADATDAERTKTVLLNVKRALDTDMERRRLSISQGEINSLLRMAARGLPFLRGKASVTADAVRLSLSATLPGSSVAAWLNLELAITPSIRSLQLASIRIGRFELPAGFVMPTLGFVLDAALGDGLGSVAINSIDGLVVEGKSVSLGIVLTPGDRQALLARAKERLREVASFSSAEDVRVYYLALDQAAVEGRLPVRGSFLPYIRFAFDLARRRAAKGEATSEKQSAILALAIYCGHWRVQNLVGKVIPMNGRPSRCGAITLGGRGDLRQHFIVSAALEVASNSGLAFAVGEFKELLDSNRGGSGFSFDDLAADLAGVRFALTVLEDGNAVRERQGWLDGVSAESAIFPEISGLPTGLSEAEFERRYSAVGSPAYQKVLATIEQRIDRLSFYAAR